SSICDTLILSRVYRLGPGISALELQTARETLVYLDLQRVVPRLCQRRVQCHGDPIGIDSARRNNIRASVGHSTVPTWSTFSAACRSRNAGCTTHSICDYTSKLRLN